MRLHRISVIFFILALAVFAVGNGSLPITDPVESNYALTAKEMVMSGNWLSPQIYHTFWFDKPIMIYWLIGASYKIFGITDFAARFPSALFGALSVSFFYQVVRTISGRRLLSIWCAFILGSSLEFWLLARGIVTDMVLLYTTIGVFAYAYRGLTENKTWFIVLAYIFAGLGTLTKGPVAIVLPGLLLLVFALVNRSWTMIKRLFAWQGLLAFCIVTLPWYVYMYMTHGQDFINGFLGLHNVVRATQSEHPGDNHWWYYLAVMPVAALPWTGAIFYGMYYGWKQKQSFYVLSMILGWGTVLFYTLMATKYPTYTFISMIPFSFLGAIGTVKILRPGSNKRQMWILMGPAFFLWILLGVASFFVPWGFWYLLYVFIVAGIILTVATYVKGKRYMLPVVITITTLAISGVVIHEGIQPLVAQRSSVAYVEDVEEFSGPIYYFAGYSASAVYYTDKPVTRIDSYLVEPKEIRSAAWDEKYQMPMVKEEQALVDILGAQAKGEKSMIIVAKGEQKYFVQSPLYTLVTLQKQTAREFIYVMP